MQKQSTFITIIETVNWLKIVLSPTLVGGILGFVVMLAVEGTMGKIVFGILMATGLVLGIVLANSIKKKYGTTHFVSRTNASPDIDDILNKDRIHKR